MKSRTTSAVGLSLVLVLAACSSSDPEEALETSTTVVSSGNDDPTSSEQSPPVESDEADVDSPTTTDSDDDGVSATTEPVDADPDSDSDSDSETDEPDDADPNGNAAILSAEDLGAGWELYFEDANTLQPADLTFPDCDTEPPATGLAGSMTFFQNEELGDLTQMVFDSDQATIEQWFDTFDRIVECGEVTENGSLSVYSEEPLSSDLGADDVRSLRARELDAAGNPATGAILVFARFGDTLMVGVTNFGIEIAELDADWVGAQLALAAQKAGLI